MKRPLPKLPIGGKYIDILTDWSFKRIFSGESNKKNLIELLNDLLVGEKHIRDLAYMPTEELGGNDRHRRIIFDLKCVGEKGEIFLELTNFVKRDDEIRTDMDQWFWLFKHLSEADRLPAFMKKNVFKRIFDIAEIANLTAEELMAYNASIQAKWDWENAIALAEEKAVERALKKERAKVEAEKIQSVRRMLTKGLSVADAAEISGLSVKEITEIQIQQKGK